MGAWRADHERLTLTKLLVLEALQQLLYVHAAPAKRVQGSSIAGLPHQGTRQCAALARRAGAALDDLQAYCITEITRHAEPDVEQATGATREVVRNSHGSVQASVHERRKAKRPQIVDLQALSRLWRSEEDIPEAFQTL